jgi:hypothetical protein
MWLIVKFQGVSIATTFMTKTSLQIIKKNNIKNDGTGHMV